MFQDMVTLGIPGDHRDPESDAIYAFNKREKYRTTVHNLQNNCRMLRI